MVGHFRNVRNWGKRDYFHYFLLVFLEHFAILLLYRCIKTYYLWSNIKNNSHSIFNFQFHPQKIKDQVLFSSNR